MRAGTGRRRGTGVSPSLSKARLQDLGQQEIKRTKVRDYLERRDANWIEKGGGFSVSNARYRS